ncbi:hypothetical protein IFM89_014630 [Coptis chinensis]|uniref:Uncharacterized protein n=1 Tax=Coptis chinensis TaxID=261450 RepID=A0A835HXQ1_9MAGN|nr:hypothetical protein IFM89_014630 [Coptis chinensis]
MSSTRSFISSLSMDSSVANLSSNSFQLIGAPQSSSSQQMHKRRYSVRDQMEMSNVEVVVNAIPQREGN